ncbi:MAG: DUF6394 family protein [Propionibacteriaceae bacterium]|jgi:ABC-type siderophore export system fused ATPase/permease subunit|nr:DUF6394 family protein [Propionibacteriaceae bacterium]
MSLEKVFFGFCVLLAATLNFGFFLGDLSTASVHSIVELYAAIVVGLVATVLKLGDRTQIGAVHLATSLVADIQLIAAAVVYTVAQAQSDPIAPSMVATAVSLSGGALFANVVSVILLVIETASFRRR